jgi:hypothetical protein
MWLVYSRVERDCLSLISEGDPVRRDSADTRGSLVACGPGDDTALLDSG